MLAIYTIDMDKKGDKEMNKFKRRTFLKAAAATGVAASVPVYMNLNEHKKVASEAPVTSGWSQCNACSSMCSLRAYAKNNRLWKVEGHPLHLKAGGRLCARGHGFATDIYNTSRVTEPMKRVPGTDTFEPISWEQAFSEIGAKLNELVERGEGHKVLWAEHGPRGYDYASILLDLVGSDNYCTHYSTCFTSKTNVWPKMVGSMLAGDHENADYMVFAGRNFAGAIIPNGMSRIQESLARGAKLIVVDPKYNEMAKVATEWIPIRPGTDLAFFLALSHTLIEENLYDKNFVKNHVKGFDEFWAANSGASAEWAADVTGIPAETIRRIAREMAAHAPKAFLEPGYHGLHSHYGNSTKTAQANVILNALLGNFYKIGGMYPGQSVPLGKPDQKQPPTKRKQPRADGAGVRGNMFVTCEEGRGISQVTPDSIARGEIKAAFFYNYNPLRTAPDPEEQKKIRNAEMVVVIPTDWNETAFHTADYVLPEDFYLERMEAPKAVNGHLAHLYPQIAIRDKILEPIHNTKPVRDIVRGIIEGMGHEGYINYTVEDEIEAALQYLEDVTMERMLEEGVIEFNTRFKEGVPADHVTNFSVDEYKRAGFSGVPVWEPPLTWPAGADQFRLIHGKQPWHAHCCTTNNPYLMAITKEYNGEWIWMNKGRADALGIKNGDTVTMTAVVDTTNERFMNQVVSADSITPKTRQVKIKSTELLHPDCVWVANTYGGFSDKQELGYGYGVNFNDFLEVQVEPMAGGTNSQEIIVSITKGGK